MDASQTYIRSRAVLLMWLRAIVRNAASMEEYTRYSQLSKKPFSQEELLMLQTTFQIVKVRYPNGFNLLESIDSQAFPSLDAFHGGEKSLLPPLDTHWRNFMLSQSINLFDDSILALARGSHISIQVMNSYLQLLRPISASIFIMDPVIFPLNHTFLRNVQPENHASILPIQKDNSWAFAAIYADCVHWFDPSDNVEMESILSEWAKDKVPDSPIKGPCPRSIQTEDSGLFVLLSIRLLMGGHANPTQRWVYENISEFRTRVFAEVFFEKLNPNEEILQWVGEPESTFFDDAVGAYSPCPLLEPMFGEEPSQSPISVTEQLRHLPPANVSIRPALRHPSQIPQAPLVPPMSEECKRILRIISGAVVSYRSSRGRSGTDLAVLWSCIRGSALGDFYRRYNAILFCQKLDMMQDDEQILRAMGSLSSSEDIKEMRRMQSKSQVWRDLCELESDWEEGKYALLCTFPEGTALERMPKVQQQAEIARIRERLQNPLDQLRKYIAEAKNICSRLIRNDLPSKLFIDTFSLKAHQQLEESLYSAFLSLDPTPRVAIPRI